MKMLIVYSCCAFCTISQNSDLQDYTKLTFPDVVSDASTTSLSAFCSYVDSKFESTSSKHGMLLSGVTADRAVNVGLPAYGYTIAVFGYASGARLAIAYPTNGDAVTCSLAKISGSWQTAWRIYTNVAANNYTISNHSNTYNNVIDIDYNNPNSVKNAPHVVSQFTDSNPITGMPPGYRQLGDGFYGIRYVHYYNSTLIMIELVPCLPNLPRYYRAYNTNVTPSGWGDWYKDGNRTQMPL